MLAYDRSTRMEHAKKRVAVAYHFFAHYRAAVIERLARDPRHQWDFYGDVRDFDSDIKPADFSSSVRFHRLPCRKVRGPVMWQHGLVGLALSDRCDVMIFLGSPKYLATWVAAPLARLTGKRVLFWTHGWTKDPHGAGGLFKKLFYQLADALLIYGRWGRQVGIWEGFDPARLHVIHNSLDTDSQRAALAAIPAGRPSEIRREFFGEDVTPVIACTTRLTRARRLDMLFDAVAMLAKEGVRANVALVGDGAERANLEAHAKRLGINVKFVGACYDEVRIGEILRASNVCVAPGQVGLSAMHAMAFGIPVVSHGDRPNQMPEFESIIPGKTGSLFQEGDLRSLADAIRPWLATQWVPDATSAECRRIIDRFWNPEFQARAIIRAIEGRPADDLFWIKEPPLEGAAP